MSNDPFEFSLKYRELKDKVESLNSQIKFNSRLLILLEMSLVLLFIWLVFSGVLA